MINRNWGELRPAKHQDLLLPNILPWQGYFNIAMPQDNFLPEPKPWKGEIPSGFGIPLSLFPTWPQTGLGFSEATIILGMGLIKQLEMQGEENLLLHNFLLSTTPQRQQGLAFYLLFFLFGTPLSIFPGLVSIIWHFILSKPPCEPIFLLWHFPTLSDFWVIIHKGSSEKQKCISDSSVI